MNCLALTSRCCEFTAFFGVFFQWENATKSVILCEKWRTKFPTHCYSYQPLTCCIGLQQFSGTLYWEIKTLWSQFRFFRNGACMKRALLHMKGRDTLWTLYTSACGALIPSHCCSSVLLWMPLSSCCAELHGRSVFAGVSAAAQKVLSMVCNWQKGSS